MTLAFSLLI